MSLLILSLLLFLLFFNSLVNVFKYLLLVVEDIHSIRHLSLLVFPFSHHFQSHSCVALDVDLYFWLDFHLFRLGVIQDLWFLLIPQLFLGLFGHFGSIHVSLYSSNAVIELFVSNFILLQIGLNIRFLIEEIITYNLVLFDSQNSNIHKSSEVELEHVVGIDSPKLGVLINHWLKSEQEVSQELQTVWDSVEVSESTLWFLEHCQQEIISIVYFFSFGAD